MNCERIQLKVSRMVDGELPQAEVAAVREHLASCPACREFHEQAAACAGMLRDRARSPQTPEAAWADIRRGIRLQDAEKKESGRNRHLVPPLRWAYGLAAVLVVCSGLVLTLRFALAPSVSTAAETGTEVLRVETGLANASTMVYEDADSGCMVIWVVPGDQEMNGATS